MRLHFHLTPNHQIVPFDYQRKLVGAFHRWLGENDLHDAVSLYSLSWLKHGTQAGKRGLVFPNGSSFYVSSYRDELLSKLIMGVQSGYQIAWGMEVDSITIQRTPDFGERQWFKVDSPVLLRERVENFDAPQYYFPWDKEANRLLNQTFQTKLQHAGLDAQAVLHFDPSYTKRNTKKINYNGVDIKAAYCPVIVEGDARAVQFAWETGVGHSTGIGFGALV